MEAEPASLFLFLPPALSASLSLEVVFGVVSILFLLIGSALVSGSEVAFFSLTNNDFERLQQENAGNSRRILLLKDKPRSLLATILISNNFINIAIVILSEFVLRRILPNGIFEQWGESILTTMPLPEWVTSAGLARVISFLITVVGVTFLLVLFGEVAPKVYAKLNNVRLAKFMSAPLLFLMQFFRPISNVLVRSTRLIEMRLADRAKGASITSREDLDEAIELTVSLEEDAEQEIDILKSIVKFGDVSVKQVMTSRVDVVAVDFRIGYEELLRVARESGFSRIPVYENDFDNVTGILYVKDLLGYLNEDSQFEWQQLIRPNVLYVPEAKKIDDLLKEFQKKHLHLAIVVDEYGGSAGIITLEDILEEIIGDIKDEFDDEVEVVYKKIDDYNYLFEGKTLLNDACRAMGISTSTFDDIRGESDSLAGLILELHGRLPKKDVVVEYNHFTFKIVSVNKRRIEQVLLTLPRNVVA